MEVTRTAKQVVRMAKIKADNEVSMTLQIFSFIMKIYRALLEIKYIVLHI